MHYPLLEHNGHFASLSVVQAHGGRWRSFVTLERDQDFARLKAHSTPISVPNDYPSNVAAAQAAYDHARMLISRAEVSA